MKSIDMQGKSLFISHHSNTCKELVAEVAALVEDVYNIKCWYSERDIHGSQNYTKVIPEVLSTKSGALLLLHNAQVNGSDQILREVQMALALKPPIPILMIKLDDSELSDVFKYISSTIQIVEIKNHNLAMTAQLVAEEVTRWLNDGVDENASIEASGGFVSERDVNNLEFFGDEGERERLRHQRYFVYNFAKETYDKILSDKSRTTFLDIGCNTGEQSMMFLENYPHVKYIGIDREKRAIERGAELFPGATYFNVDTEKEDLDVRLSEIEEELDIDGFDVINVSMVLLHLKRPRVLIDALCDHLSDNGKLIILDIDDGLNVAYPDKEGDFKKAIDICFETEYSGYRHSGRQIYEFLSKQNLDNIVLEKAGMSTVGMSRNDKGHFFDIYFWFVLDDLRKMHAENPKNNLVKHRLDWMEANYKQMRMNFKERGFFFNLGFMIYTAG